MSCRTSSASRSAGNERMSPSRLRVNSTLPAPTSTIRVTDGLLAGAQDVAQALAVVPLDPVGAVWVGAAQAGEGEGERGRPAARRTAARGPRGRRVAAAGGSRSPTSADGPTSIVRAPHAAAWVSRSATAGRAGPVRGERDDHGIRPQHRGRARGHLPHLGALGVDQRHLLELERGLERGRVRDAAAGHEQVAGVTQGCRERFDDGLRRGDRRLGRVGGGEDPGDLVVGPLRTEELEQQQLGRDERRRERLGHHRHDRRAAGREDDVGRDPGQRRARHVDDAGHRDPAAHRLRDRDDVLELARGRDPDDRVGRVEVGWVDAGTRPRSWG